MMKSTRKVTINDPILRHKTDMKKVMTLTNKSIVSTSLKEKNDLLIDIQELFTPICEAFEKHQTILKIKNDELNGFKKKLNEATNQKDTLQRNTAFYSHADQARIRNNEEKLIESIKSLESNISKHHPLSYPNRLSDTFQLPPKSDKRLFTLIDVNLRRIEELSYCFKKRLIIVEESQESTEIVLRDYGSINDLIEKVRELEKENERLRNDEKAYLHDAVTRRRKFAQVTPICARSIAESFSKMIKCEKCSVFCFKEEEFPVTFEAVKTDFDRVTSDSGFSGDPLIFDPDYFGNSTEMDLLTPILDVNNSTTGRVGGFMKVNDNIKTQIKKIENEIASIPNRYDIPKDTALSRIEKIAEANERLLTRMHKIAQQLDDRLVNVLDEAKLLSAMNDDRRKMYNFYIHALGNYKRLTESHIDLVKRQTSNKKILSLLFELTSAFGIQILWNRKHDENIISKDVYAKFDTIFQQLKNDEMSISESLKQQLDDSKSFTSANDPSIEPITAQTLQQKLLLMKKKKPRNAGPAAGGYPVSANFSRARSSSSTFVIQSDLDAPTTPVATPPPSAPKSPRNLKVNNNTTSSSSNNNPNYNNYIHNNDNNDNINNNNNCNNGTNGDNVNDINFNNNSHTLFFFGRPKMEVIHGLSFAMELAGFVKGVDRKFKGAISKFLIEFLSIAKNDTKERINTFGKPFESELNQINMCANAILVKQKDVKTVQTDVQKRFEQEIQTLQSGFAKPKSAKPPHK